MHGCVTIRVLGIKHLCFAILGQSVDPLIDHIFSPISGSLQERGGKEGKGKEKRKEGGGGGGGGGGK